MQLRIGVTSEEYSLPGSSNATFFSGESGRKSIMALKPERKVRGPEKNKNREYHPGRLDTLPCLSLPRPVSDWHIPCTPA